MLAPRHEGTGAGDLAGSDDHAARSANVMIEVSPRANGGVVRITTGP
jgi:hypothetical protein